MWRQSDAVIYQGWLGNARKKYSELLSVAHSGWENGEEPDRRIGQNVYLKWIEFWQTPEFQKKSTKFRIIIVPLSLAHRFVITKILQKMKYNKEPTADQVFLLTHTRRGTKKKHTQGENSEDDVDEVESDYERIWVDKKSQQTYVSHLNFPNFKVVFLCLLDCRFFIYMVK